MVYNVYFLYAALIILALIIINCFISRHSNILGHRIFIFALIIGFIDVLLDLITCYLFSWQKTELLWLTTLLMTLFIICQFILPYIFVMYLSRMRSSGNGKLDKFTKILGIPTLVFIIITITNPFTKILFYFDDSAQYIHGPIYYSIYIYAFVYIFIILFRIISFRKEDAKLFRGFLTYIIISLIAIAIQLLNPHIMAIGFGLSLGLMSVYIDISGPLSFRDHLTDLPNRPAFINWVNQKRTPFYCVFFGFSDFGKMNQIYSVRIMNLVLKNISRMIASTNAKNKSFSISISKFLTVFETREAALAFTQKLQNYFSEPLIIEGTSIKCNVGIAFTYVDERLLKTDEVLTYLEYMLTRCFRENSGSISDSEKLRSDFAYEHEVELYLSTAISKDLFEIFLQPIYSVKEHKFVSVEVLSRLKHPELGYISPSLFIPLSEKNGSIDRISLLQFNHLCEFLKENPEFVNRVDGIKYNLSPHELIAHSHALILPEMIKEYGLPLDKFEFEITESVASEHGDALVSSVETIKSYGIRLNMDDFGSGYANLNVALKLPFDCLKFDKSLLTGILEKESVALFYHDQINVFHRLGLSIVSEGVETEEEFKLLESWGTDMIQGFYFAKPMPAKEALEFFKNN